MIEKITSRLFIMKRERTWEHRDVDTGECRHRDMDFSISLNKRPVTIEQVSRAKAAAIFCFRNVLGGFKSLVNFK